jgi:hypothetical protein
MPLHQPNNPIVARMVVKQISYQSKEHYGVEIQYHENGENKIAARCTF